MASLFGLLVASHLLAVLVTAVLAAYVYAVHREKPIGRVFTALVGSFSVWILGALGRLFTLDPGVYLAVTTVKYVGITTAPVAFFLFALQYDGKSRWVTRRSVTALGVVPMLTLVALATTLSHGLFYSDFAVTTIGATRVLETDVGVLFWGWAVYAWTLLVLGSGLLIYAGLKRSAFYRIQTVVVFVAILVAWGINLAYVFWEWPHPAVDPTPLGFALASVLIGVGVFSTRLIDVVPTARFLVLDAIDDLVVVLDPNGRVVDVNEAGLALFDGDAPIGSQASEVLPAALVAEPELPSGSDVEAVELDVEGERRFYRTRRLPVGPEGLHGRVLILTDATSAVRTRRQLQRQNDRLERFTSVVAHDIRNPLGVATGNLAAAREERDSEDLETVARAHDRMETLVGDLRTLARQGRSVADPEPVDLDDVAREAWETVPTRTATLDLEGDVGMVQADCGVW